MDRVRMSLGIVLAMLMLALGAHTVTMAVHQMPPSGGHAHSHDDADTPPLAMAVASCLAVLAALAGLSLVRIRTGLVTHIRTWRPLSQAMPLPASTGRPPPRTGTILRT